MKNLLLFHILLFVFKGFCQPTNGPVEITPAIRAKINQAIIKSVERRKQELLKAEESEQTIEFTLDTLRVEILMAKTMEYDYSTVSMNDASYYAARQYDSLLNKYYKRLLSVLKVADKNTLIKAQKAWIVFRDSEMKLVDTMSKEEYSGGGTVQQLIDSSAYLAFIKSRAVALFEHYSRTFQP